MNVPVVTSGSGGGIPFSWRLTWGKGRSSFLQSLSMNREEKKRPTSGARRRTMFPASTELNLETHKHYQRFDLHPCHLGRGISLLRLAFSNSSQFVAFKFLDIKMHCFAFAPIPHNAQVVEEIVQVAANC